MKTHVIISGGSKGIGKAVAIEYASLGADVTIIARGKKDLAEAKDEIEKNRKRPDQKVRTVSLDLTKIKFPTPSSDANDETPLEHDATTREILGEQGVCDILINCCGSAIPTRFEDLTQEQFHYMMDINYFSAVNLTRLLLPAIKLRSAQHKTNQTSTCRIVFVSSMCGLMSFYGYSAYSASKFALVGLAEALQMELEQYGIRITVSFPPDTETPGLEAENRLKPPATAEISKSGSLYSPQDVARSIVRDVDAKRFFSTVGLENWLAVTASNAFMPNTLVRSLFESLIAGPLKLVAFLLVRSWYGIVRRSVATGDSIDRKSS